MLQGPAEFVWAHLLRGIALQAEGLNHLNWIMPDWPLAPPVPPRHTLCVAVQARIWRPLPAPAFTTAYPSLVSRLGF